MVPWARSPIAPQSQPVAWPQHGHTQSIGAHIGKNSNQICGNAARSSDGDRPTHIIWRVGIAKHEHPNHPKTTHLSNVGELNWGTHFLHMQVVDALAHTPLVAVDFEPHAQTTAPCDALA